MQSFLWEPTKVVELKNCVLTKLLKRSYPICLLLTKLEEMCPIPKINLKNKQNLKNEQTAMQQFMHDNLVYFWYIWYNLL